jgi:hemolysin activation/secretion protein
MLKKINNLWLIIQIFQCCLIYFFKNISFKKILTKFLIIIYIVALPQQTNAILLANNIPTLNDFGFKEDELPTEDEILLFEPEEEEIATPESDKDVRFAIKRLNFIDNTVLSDDQLKDLTENYLNKEYNFTELQQILRSISSFYRQLGLWARAIFPEQDIVDGVLTVQIIEGKLGKVIIETDEEILNLDQEIAKKYIENRISRNQILNINQVEKNIQTLNKVPGILAVATLEQGLGVGETDILVRLENLKKLSGTFQADNYGSRSSGNNRGTLIVNADSFLKKGEQLTLQQVQTDGSEYSALATSFRIGYDGMRGTVKAAKLRYDLGEPFNSTNPTGNSEELSLNIYKPLNSIEKINLESNLTLSKSEYENKNNTPSNVQKKITKAIGKLDFSRNDQFFKGGSNYGSFIFTVGDLKDSSTTSATNGALGEFSKFNLNFNRFQRLSDQNVLQVNLSSQYAFKNLDSSEKFTLGGPYGIRAYPTSEGQGDHGLMANIELKHGFTDKLEGMVFYDWGKIQQHQNSYTNWNSGNPSLENIYELQGVGVGFTWNINEKSKFSGVFSTTTGKNQGEDANGLDNDGLTKDKRAFITFTTSF